MLGEESTQEISCSFCKIGVNAPELMAYDKPIIESANFVAFPSLGHLCSGYLLVTPRLHLKNFLQLPRENLPELKVFINSVKQLLYKEYGIWPIMFEHGRGEFEDEIGSSIDHAHLHFAPLSIESPPPLVNEILGTGKPVSWDSIREVYRDGCQYFLFQTSLGEMYYYISPNLPHQFGRRIIARHLGLSDDWNWRINPLENQAINTITNLMTRTSTHSTHLIYFAQPVDGQRANKLSDSVNHLSTLTKDLDVEIISPYLEEMQREPDIPTRTEALQILKKDYMILESCDVLLIDLSISSRQPIGIICEMVRAWEHHIPIIVYHGYSNVNKRVFMIAMVDYFCKSWEEVIHSLIKILKLNRSLGDNTKIN